MGSFVIDMRPYEPTLVDNGHLDRFEVGSAQISTRGLEFAIEKAEVR